MQAYILAILFELSPKYGIDPYLAKAIIKV